MNKIYLITQIQRGPAGHGEPGCEYLTLKCDNTGCYTLGKPISAFKTCAAAQEYLSTFDTWGLYLITGLDLVG
jgi:hypothetical protein